MNSNNPVPDHIQKMDWRINNLTWTTAPFRLPQLPEEIPAGAAVIQAAVVDYGGKKLGINIPNATAMFLGLAQVYREEAQMWLERAIATQAKGEQLPDRDIFEFYERMMASVVFACTSLEAFVNEEIPDNYSHVVPEKNFTRHFTKEQIERQLNLDTKLGDVLPAALNVTSPKGGSLWNDYYKLRELRDRVIHMKTKDREFMGSDPNSIWNALLSDPLPDTYKIAKAMMKYFLDAKGTRPRWFEKCPF